MTHGSKPGYLFTYKGHGLTVLEGHGLLFGVLGGLAAGFIAEVSESIEGEPQYVGGGFLFGYVVGRLVRILLNRS